MEYKITIELYNEWTTDTGPKVENLAQKSYISAKEMLPYREF